jgi:hypothetical protein
MSNLKNCDTLRDLTLFIPVYNLKIYEEIGSEIQIERVTFISKEKIPRVRKRLGFKKPIHEFNKKWEKTRRGRLFQEADVYAAIRFKSKPKLPEIEPRNKIQDALWILASSQFFRTNRYNIQYFGLPEHQLNIMGGFTLYDSELGFTRAFKRQYPMRPYVLDKTWKNIYLKNHFFFPLLKIINNKHNIRISSNWENTIRNATILAGKSHFSKDLPQQKILNRFMQ